MYIDWCFIHVVFFFKGKIEEREKDRVDRRSRILLTAKKKTPFPDATRANAAWAAAVENRERKKKSAAIETVSKSPPFPPPSSAPHAYTYKETERHI